MRVRSGETEAYLFDDDAKALAEMLSDLGEGSFVCQPRFNCEPEDHGNALFEFVTGTYQLESGFSEAGSAHLTLWEDGRLTFTRPEIVTCGFSPDHELLCDWLNMPCLYVFDTAFDVEKVSAFLAEKAR